MSNRNDPLRFPPYSYVPGLWPHPHSHPDGHRFGPPFPEARLDDLSRDSTFRLGVDLFDAGYYWEAHEAWEHLWHAAGRTSPIANVLKGLIQLAVAGVKVREGREDGVRAHARRAAELLEGATDDFGLRLDRVIAAAREVAATPPTVPETRRPVEIVFGWRLSGTKNSRESDSDLRNF